MQNKSIILSSLLILMILATTAPAKIHLAFDCGGCGPHQQGWIALPTCGTYTNVGGTDIDVTVSLYDTSGECSCRGYFDETSDGPATGPLAAVEQDFLFANDVQDSPKADIVLTFKGLVRGAQYMLSGFHNRLDEGASQMQGVEITGATNINKPDKIDQEHNRMINPATMTFTAGTGDVSIRYFAPKKRSKRGQVFLNGFILEGGPADVSFETATSAATEDQGVARIKVKLSDPQQVPVTVDCHAKLTPRQAQSNDFRLKDKKLIFAPGQTEQFIELDIINDKLAEQDESLELVLSNVSGADVQPGAIMSHTHTIIDSTPVVEFAKRSDIVNELQSSIEIPVTLSHPSDKTVIVRCHFRDGTATAGEDYIGKATELTFAPGQTTAMMNVQIVNDGIIEPLEQFRLMLSGRGKGVFNAKFGQTTYTGTIVDHWADYAFEMFKVDLGCPDKPDTFKPGWTPWEIIGGCDDYPQQASTITNIAGTNIDARISIQGDKDSGDLRISSGQPICNSYFSHYNKYPAEVGVELTLSGKGLVAGEYWLYAYHNTKTMSTIPKVTVSGEGASQINVVNDVQIQAETSDDDLVASVVKFYTDGSGPVTLTYQAPAKSNAAINAFELHGTVTPAYATNPEPAHKAIDISPNMTFTWVAGNDAVSHNVYLGSDLEAVTNASTGSPQYKGSVKTNSFKPGLLKFGQSYYWRVDEVAANGSVIPSKVWKFTADRGQARDPIPANKGNAVTQTTLYWSAGEYGKKHDVYFATDHATLQKADKSSPQFKGTLSRTSYKPKNMESGKTYYWRVDEVGDELTVQGDVWTFNVTEPPKIKVDFALTKSDGSGIFEGTAKSGWWHWSSPAWADMYMHDGVWENGSNVKPQDKGIAGTGVHGFVTTGSEGQLGLHVKGMCRDNLGGGGVPTGTPEGDPIANSWFYAVDWAGQYGGDIMLLLTDMPAGRYELISYHNHWEPCKQSTRNCLDCVCGMPPMPSVTANPLPESGMYGYASHWGLPKPQGKGAGVKAIQNAFDVAPSNSLKDAEVAKSKIIFETDGSEVLVIYRASNAPYPDCARKRRDGNRGILNAFELNFVAPVSIE